MDTRISKHALKIGLMFLAIVSMIVGIALPAYAEDSNAPNMPAFHIVQGRVSNVSALGFEVTTANQQQVDISVNGNTQYYIIPTGKAQGNVNSSVNPGNREENKRGAAPRLNGAARFKDLHIPANWRSNLGWLAIFNHQASFSDIAEGDRVIVRVENNDTNTNIAEQVLIIKAPVLQQIRGTISYVTDNSITINSTSGGSDVTLSVNGNTRVTLKGLIQVNIGDYGIAIYNRDTMIADTINIQSTAPATANSSSITLSSINVSPASATLLVGNTLKFTPTATYSNSTTRDITSRVTWGSSNLAVATIAPSGLVTGKQAGSTTITATFGKVSGSAILTVSAP